LPSPTQSSSPAPTAKAKPLTPSVPSTSSFASNTSPAAKISPTPVLALGDSTYEHFCKFGIDLDNKLASLAGTRLANRVDCDVDLDEGFTTWKTALYTRIDDIVAARPAKSAPSSSITVTSPDTATRTAPLHTRDNPYLAQLIDKRPLTHDVSSKLTIRVALNISDSSVSYEAGDACGVIPQNDIQLVEEILRTLNFSGTVPVQLPKTGSTDLYDALLNHLQITRLTRKMIEAYATIGKHTGRCQPLFNLLIPEQQAHLEKYTYDRGLIDLLHDYPGILHEPADLVAMLPRLSPRLYSISSSPSAHAGEIHTTVAVVRYRAHNRDRGGVCSTLLSDRTNTGESLPVYIQPNKRFRLPSDPAAPIIMIGPGTGIAPFRSFLHERLALGATGRNWLFFGERSAATDFLYRDELQSMHTDGHLTRLDLASSRDQDRKIYVQDRMLEQAPHLLAVARRRSQHLRLRRRLPHGQRRQRHTSHHSRTAKRHLTRIRNRIHPAAQRAAPLPPRRLQAGPLEELKPCRSRPTNSHTPKRKATSCA
jgi:sulfite reductase (NADPH) flavoprotein alpha-component